MPRTPSSSPIAKPPTQRATTVFRRAGGILRTQETKAAGVHPRTLAAMDDQAVAAIQSAVTGGQVPEPLVRRAGPIRGVTITRREVTGLTEPTISVAFNADGAHATAFGVAEFGTVPGTLPPKLIMRSLRGMVGDEAFEIVVATTEEKSK